jgi:hypothetical protein
MNPKMRRELQQLNTRLAKNRQALYLDLLRACCLDHPGWFGSSLILKLVRAKDYDGLITLADSLLSQLYDNPTDHFVANQFAALIRKFPFPEGLTSCQPLKEAKRKFWRAEHTCARVNQRFRAFNKRSPYESLLSRARSFIAYCIGHEPDLLSIYENCGFGPGAAIGVHGNGTNLARKLLSESWSVTPSAFALGFAACRTHHQIYELLLDSGDDTVCYDPSVAYIAYAKRAKLVHNNKISFVPKTAKVHRTIAIEPLMNSYLQKGIDKLMRCKLKRVGINLQDQSLNQRMAREGSLDDSEDGFVTIDLSSASDSISRGVVANLLPPEWVELLNSTRSGAGTIDGVSFRYHKFCSMGNGFCFPLETLLFTAACVATDCGTPGIDFSVYGDDIIVRKKHSANLITFLSVLGFSVNSDKTFLQGPFRESCGADWFGGEDVRPFTLDFELDSLSSLFKFLNLSSRNERSKLFFLGVRDVILSRIPTVFRFFRPFVGNEDSGIDVDKDEFLLCRHAKWNFSLQCWSWLELQSSGVGDTDVAKLRRYPRVLVMGALTGSASQKPFTLRNIAKTKIRRMAYSGATSLWIPPTVSVCSC